MTCFVTTPETSAIFELAEGGAMDTVEDAFGESYIASAHNALRLCTILGCEVHGGKPAERRLRALLAKLAEERREAERDEALECCPHHCSRCTP